MKILLVKTSSLGDILQSFGVVAYLKARFPQAQIDWVVEKRCQELVAAHPAIERCFPIESRHWRRRPFFLATWKDISFFRKKLRAQTYDLVFDLQGNMKSGLIVALAKAQAKIGFGWKTLPEWPAGLFTSYKYNPPPGKTIREDYLALVQSYCETHARNSLSEVGIVGAHPPLSYVTQECLLDLNPADALRLEQLVTVDWIKKFTLVCPSAAWPNKCLAEAELVAFLKAFQKGPYWFVCNSKAEREKALRVHAAVAEEGGRVLASPLSLPLLQQLMARARLVIAMDSLPLHLAATTYTETISFFGPSSAAKYRPLGPQHQVFQGSCPYGVRFEKRCPHLRTCPTALCLPRTPKASTPS